MLTEVVKQNIIQAIANQQFNSRVMTGDHVVTSFERKRYILPYDNTKKRISNKLKRMVATAIVNKHTKKLASQIIIHDFSPFEELKNKGFIITANHFSPYDSLVIRSFCNKKTKRNKLSIVVAESNVFMKGKLGWLLKNINTMPFTNDIRYIDKNFNPSLAKCFKKKHCVLFYPEQEMWPSYIKPRPLKSGAYHYASKFLVPVVPTFIALEKKECMTIYHLYIGKIIYPERQLSIKENKERMLIQDYSFKKEAYEQFYKKRLDYNYSESDFIY